MISYILKKSFVRMPIKQHEVPRFLIVSLMMLMILFIYSVQRNTKDTLIVPDLGAELLPTIKLWVVTPLSVLFLLIYTKMSDLVNKTSIFHIFNAFFVSYFLFFTFIIQKKIDFFHLNLNHIKVKLPIFKHFLIATENWSYTLYFALSELWGSVMLSLMFWQVSNQVFKIKEAKRLYPLFGILAQLGLLLSYLVVTFSDKWTNNWEEKLTAINLSVTIAAIILSMSFRFLYNNLVCINVINTETVKKKKKMSLSESLKHIATSKYICLIAAIIICYGVSINLVEVLWKSQIGTLYSDKKLYSNYMASLQIYTGLSSMVIMLFSSYILKSITWRTAAMITPTIIIVTGMLFFIFSVFKNNLNLAIMFFTISPLSFTAAIGLIQNVLSKSTKYAFFDSTKEMAYIPLDDELKSKGKAAADVIGGRLGKAGGSLILWILLLIPGTTTSSIMPIVFFVFIIVTIVWFVSIEHLSHEFNKKIKEK